MTIVLLTMDTHVRMDPERLTSAFVVEFTDKEADGDNGIDGHYQE